MAGDHAVKEYPTFTMCEICGTRWEANGWRIRELGR